MSGKDREVLYQHARAIGEASRLSLYNMHGTLESMSNHSDIIATIAPVNQQVLAERIAHWCETLDQRSADKHGHDTFSVEKLTKYIRVVCNYRGVSRSVHAFVDPNTGDVYKPAGWKAPAKIARYNLLNDDSYAGMIAHCDPTGGYLYLR